MLEEADHYRVVNEALAGERKLDADVLASAAVLKERLSRVRQLGGAFAAVGLSEQVQRFCGQKGEAVVC